MKRTRRRRKRSRSPLFPSTACESLENRTMLTASLGADGLLNIEGTADADEISVRVEGENIVVNENGEETSFAAADVDQIFADLGEGDDRFIIRRGVDVPATVDGGAGNDVIVGGSAGDILNGGEGDDRIHGRSGDDTIDGGEGDDRLNGGRGDDNLIGGDGDDCMRGGSGDDIAEGNDGDDHIKGGSGDDEISGGLGDDNLSAGRGSDLVFGDEDDDRLRGDSDTDVLDGGEGDNLIHDRVDRSFRGPNADPEAIAERANEVFAFLDGDDSGTLTEDEVGESRFASRIDADTDDNGEITPEEFATAFETRLEEAADRVDERVGFGRRLLGPFLGRFQNFGRRA